MVRIRRENVAPFGWDAGVATGPVGSCGSKVAINNPLPGVGRRRCRLNSLARITNYVYSGGGGLEGGGGCTRAAPDNPESILCPRREAFVNDFKTCRNSGPFSTGACPESQRTSLHLLSGRETLKNFPP